MKADSAVAVLLARAMLSFALQSLPMISETAVADRGASRQVDLQSIWSREPLELKSRNAGELKRVIGVS